MILKKTNAILGLLSALCIATHIGYSAFAYLTFYYNPELKALTATPVLVVTCLHAICGMSIVFTQGDGTRLDLYPRQNMRTIVQRLTAALFFPLLILHLNTFDLLTASSADGQWVAFTLLIVCQLLFYGTALAHVATSLTNALVTMGWLASRERQKALDRVIYVLLAAVFVVVSFVVIRTQLAMFLPV